ncbi:MAG TPA: tetratricopeptide repeat protein [Aliidongia sp.]|nr:tetratricopeptide repeat protein [Aliidongia sp.]
MGDDAVDFGPFRLVPTRRVLTRHGVPVPIGDRALDILRVLIAHAPNLVSKRTLLDQVWPGLFVDESNLRIQMVALRKALGGGEGGKLCISTITGRGYCFVAPLSWSRSGPSEQPPVPPENQSLEAAQPKSAPPEGNLPQELTNIIGRAFELAELQQSLHRNRLVTIIGPGGVGKTRLAVAVGRQVAEDFPGGIWLIDLAPLTDPVAVVSAAAAVLRVPLQNAATAVEAIAASVGPERRLLIFDNCEHLVGAAAGLINALLQRVPGLSVLATSQQELHLQAEQLYHLDPLSVPPSHAVEIAGFGAADLFVERAGAADRLFALGGDNATAVGEICRRLDGIPLALEMAAARLRTLGIEGLRRGLDDRLKLLKGTPRDRSARHDSLRAMMEWSHGLLDARDRQVFRRLAIFPGSFSLDAAIAVAGEDSSDHWDIVDALGRLLDKSLITLESREPPRYRLLETLRFYAAERLLASGETDAIGERHARHFVDIFDRADIARETMPDAEWTALYRPEIDNLRAALDWALAEPGRRQIAIALAGATGRFLHLLSFIAESRRYLDRVIPLIDQDTPPAIAARLLARGHYLWWNSDNRRALEYGERSAALYRALGDRSRMGVMLAAIAGGLGRVGRYAEARAAYDEALEILSSRDFDKTRAEAMNSLGLAAMYMNDIAEARRLMANAIEIAKKFKYIHEATYCMNLAELEFSAGDIERAIQCGRETLDCARSTPRHPYLGPALLNLASYLLVFKNPAEARPFAEEAFALLIDQGEFLAIACLQQWALFGVFDRRFEEAARLIGFVAAHRARRGGILDPTEQRTFDQTLEMLGAGLRGVDIERLKAEGARWTIAEAVQFASSRLLTRPDSMRA